MCVWWKLLYNVQMQHRNIAEDQVSSHKFSQVEEFFLVHVPLYLYTHPICILSLQVAYGVQLLLPSTYWVDMGLFPY